MYTVWAFAAIGLFLNLAGDGEDLLASAAAGAIVGMIFAFFFGFLIPQVDDVSKPITLVALRSGDDVSGKFLYGVSNRYGTLYNYLQVNADGSLNPQTIWNSDKVHVVEDPTLTDTGTLTITRRIDNPDFLLRGFGFGNRDVTLRQDFRVPPGTILQKFEVTK